jgi:hypothetical protein
VRRRDPGRLRRGQGSSGATGQGTRPHDVADAEAALVPPPLFPARGAHMGKYFLAWLLGVPAGLLILIYLFMHLF